MTLLEAKNEIAISKGYPTWLDFWAHTNHEANLAALEEAAKLYAESKVKEKDERIAELEKVLVKVREYLRLKDLLPTLKYETNETIDAAYNQFLKVDESLREEIKIFTKTQP